MKVIRVPTPLRPYTGGRKEVETDAPLVGGALQELTARYPRLKPHLFAEDGSLRPYVNIFLNEENVRDLEMAATPLSNGDRLMIIPSIAGGSMS
jgi:MoaD family protein